MLKLINHVQVGGTYNDPTRRGIGFGNVFQPGYWKKRIKTEIQPLIDLGVTRHFIHNPFGTLPNEPMQFDQVLHARYGVKDVHGPLIYLVDEFVESWKPVVEQCRELGGEVICYLGKARDDPDQKKIDKRQDNIETTFYRWHQCLWHPDNCRMSIGFDASYNIPQSDPIIWHLMEVVRLNCEATGRHAYCEARPHKDAIELANWNVVSTFNYWKRSDPARHVDSSRWAMPNDQLTGEIVLLLAHSWVDYIGRNDQFIKDCLLEGATPCISLHTRRITQGDSIIKQFLELV